MENEEDFYLSKFLTNSLNLQSNNSSAARQMFPRPLQNSLKYITQKHPFEILGLKEFHEAKVGAENVTGSPIQEFYRGLNVMVTGGTGFVGKLLTEKLTREIPWLGHIYLLVRAKRGINPLERFERLMEDKVFERMKTEVPNYRDKMTVVEGDLSLPELGLRPVDRQLLVEKVQVVFHSAADVKLGQPLRSAIMSNVGGSKRVLDLAKDMKHLKAYLHVSTAYSQCVRRVIEERVPRMTFNYKDLMNYLETRTDEEIEEELPRLLQGWPNTYVFSKAVCEDMLQEEAVGMPVTIFRPSVVYPTYKEPVRGYIDNIYGPVGLIVAVCHGVVHCQYLDTETSLDIVPVDYTVNCMIAVAAHTLKQSNWKDIPVYNFASNKRTASWKTIINVMRHTMDVWPYDRSIWYPSFFFTKSLMIYKFNFYLLQVLPGFFLDTLAVCSGKKPRFMKIYNRIQNIDNLVRHFSLRQWIFQNDNTTNLWNSLGPEDKVKFHFDLIDVDESELFLLLKLGVKYYYLNEDVDDITKAQQKNKLLYWAHQVLKAGCYLIALKVMVCVAHVLPL